MPARLGGPTDARPGIELTDRALRLAVRTVIREAGLDEDGRADVADAARLLTRPPAGGVDAPVAHFRCDDVGVYSLAIDGHTAQGAIDGESWCDCEEGWAAWCAHRWALLIVCEITRQTIADEDARHRPLDRLADRYPRRRGRVRRL